MIVKKNQQNQGKLKINAKVGMSNLKKTLYFKCFSRLHLSIAISCGLSGSWLAIVQFLDLITDI